MIAQGVADSSRVWHRGASYGGYAALAGAAFTPDVYRRCAVGVNGVSNLVAMLGYQRNTGRRVELTRVLADHIGSSSEAAEKSPSKAAAQMRVPVMLMHAVA